MDLEQQESMAKTGFRWKAALFSGLLAGAFFLMVSKGFIYISSGLPDRVMGRAVFANSDLVFLFSAVVHLMISVVYAFLIGWLVYRLDPIPAVLSSALIGAGLFALNYLIFHFVLNQATGEEGAVFLVHVTFSMLAASLYKAFSVPRATEMANY